LRDLRLIESCIASQHDLTPTAWRIGPLFYDLVESAKLAGVGAKLDSSGVFTS
jgi:hypothetical protein